VESLKEFSFFPFARADAPSTVLSRLDYFLYYKTAC